MFKNGSAVNVAGCIARDARKGISAKINHCRRVETENRMAIATGNALDTRYAVNVQKKTPKDIYTAVKIKTAKTCPKCADTRLVVRTSKKSGHECLGCANWPECDYTEPLPLDMEMRRQGAPVLPGFE